MVVACELIAQCLGIIGLVGVSASTGLPMWKVTAFIQENIITMETRWEGLWMNCYRQANIRMQCKVYDSLLYLPAELQAARGLMCTSVALSAVGLLVSLPGLRSTTCILDLPRIKNLIVTVAGVMQIMAALSAFIPVSWTAHVIIQDFYNPLLIDAQRRELGEALYIGWVAGAFLLVSGVVFVSCRPTSKSPYEAYSSTYSHFHHLPPTPSSISSLPQQPLIPSQHLHPQQSSTYSPVAVTPAGQHVLYNGQLVAPGVPLLYGANLYPSHQQHPSSHDLGTFSALQPYIHPSQVSAPPLPRHHGKSFSATQPKHGYGLSRNESHSMESHRISGMYI